MAKRHSLEERRRAFTMLVKNVRRAENAAKTTRERVKSLKVARDELGICAKCGGEGTLEVKSDEEEPPNCPDCGGSGETD